MNPFVTDTSKMAESVDAELSQLLRTPQGSERFSLATVLSRLYEVDGLSREERCALAVRTLDVSTFSPNPFLLAERADAVRDLLEVGVGEGHFRFEGFPDATPDQMKEVLLSCNEDVFMELVDRAAAANQEFYAPEPGWLMDADNSLLAVAEAISAVVNKKDGLDAQASASKAIATKYFEIDLVNYDENNVPYNVGTVHCAAQGFISKADAAELCRDELGMDFEEVFTVTETTLDEVLEYVDEVSTIPFCPSADRLYTSSLENQIGAAESQKVPVGETKVKDEQVR